MMGSQPASKPIVESWENEGGSVSPKPDLESLGITRLMTETYAVGGYSYTNLADALAQARRMQTQAVPV
jgi:hypothetical protein